MAIAIAISTDASNVLAIGAMFDDRRKVISVAPMKPPTLNRDVEARHERLGGGALDLDRMNVHRDIEGAQRRAKTEEREPQRDRRSGHGQQRQQHSKPEPAREDDGPAAVPGVDDAGQKHRRDRAHAKAEQQQSQRAIVDQKPLFGEGNERRPAGDAEASHQKRKPRRQPRLRPICAQQASRVRSTIH